jgi:muramoyltetrapeptide carboxypeptidase
MKSFALERFLSPPALSRGDIVAVVAPSGPFDRESFDKGLALLQQRYQPRFSEDLFSAQRYLAGSDERRLGELQRALDDQQVKAIFVARGGYGAMRLLPKLKLPAQPKLLVGFSDVTALHGAAQVQGWKTVHGPVLTQLWKQPAAVQQRFFQLLESPTPLAPLEGRSLVAGEASGPLVGGNLSVLTRLIGTPYLPPLDGAVLLLEDVGERPYRLDRMWTHLELAGVFTRIKGLVLGDYTGCEEQGADYSSGDVLKSLAESTGLPCAAGFTIGHGTINEAVPLGARVMLDATRGRLTFEESLVAPPTDAPRGPQVVAL